MNYIPIYSIIVFSDRCSLENIEINIENVYICYMTELTETINNIIDNNNICVSNTKLSNIYSKLKEYSNPSEEVIKRHREYVQNIK